MHSKQSVSILAASFLAAVLPLVNAHGQVHHVSADGVSNDAPNIYYAGDAKNKNTVTRVMYKANKDGQAFVTPSGFSDNRQMACGPSGNAPAPAVLKVKAGSSVDIFWEGSTNELLNKQGTGGTSYNPFVHAMGPVLDYITSCNGDCSKFDATNAGWVKLAGAGIDNSQGISAGLRSAMAAKPETYRPLEGNGRWALATLIENGSKWTVNIPSQLKSGQYIIRHETAAVQIALAGSDPATGPQTYISCVQIDVTGGGSATLPAGTQAGQLYSPTGEYAKFNIYNTDPKTFKVPGPAVWSPSGDNAPAPAPETPAAPTTPKPEAPSTDKPSTPATDKPAAPAAPAPAAPVKCRNRKRDATPLGAAAKRAHRKRLSSSH